MKTGATALVSDLADRLRGSQDQFLLPSEEHVVNVCALYLSLRRLDLTWKTPNWLFTPSEAKMFDDIAVRGALEI